MSAENLNYLINNIASINNTKFDISATDKGVELFGSITNLKTYMKGHFNFRLTPEFKKELVNEFRVQNFKKSKIASIANKHLIAKSDLQSFYDIHLQQTIADEIDKDSLINNTLAFIQGNVTDSNHFAYTKTAIKKILEKQYCFIFSNGFPTNILNINTGIMTANAGDSAQFLFLARAILAGYNCSNVDVRSSRYDAVVDFKNILLRLQIKGVSSNSISFKDRDRGGQGIDHKHESNRGQRITSTDCDIYVAVDKEIGICYLIPMSFVDGLSIDEITSINLKEMQHYKENWDIIAEVATSKSRL
jgi:hypothetical protein